VESTWHEQAVLIGSFLLQPPSLRDHTLRIFGVRTNSRTSTAVIFRVHVDEMALVLPLLRQPAARHPSRSFASVVAILSSPHDVVVLLRIGKNLG
jgi:hypothetical protein